MIGLPSAQARFFLPEARVATTAPPLRDTRYAMRGTSAGRLPFAAAHRMRRLPVALVGASILGAARCQRFQSREVAEHDAAPAKLEDACRL